MMVRHIHIWVGDAEWKEEEHPRRKDGKFGTGGAERSSWKGYFNQEPKAGTEYGDFRPPARNYKGEVSESRAERYERFKKEDKIPVGTKLASKTDSNGYTIFVEKADRIAAHGKTGHNGQFYIRSPEGEVVPAGRWMDFPERHYDPKAFGGKQYMDLPIEERAELELRNQVSLYGGLPHDFELYKGTRK